VKSPDAFTAWLVILTDLIGGMAVLAGAFMPLVSVPPATVLWVAIFAVHLPFHQAASRNTGRRPIRARGL
jgi:uncharacterized membrane protein YphA (DoxX/SURF4 family)